MSSHTPTIKDLVDEIEQAEGLFVAQVASWANMVMLHQDGEEMEGTSSSRIGLRLNVDIYVKREDGKFIADVVDRTPGPDSGVVVRIEEGDERLPPKEAFEQALAGLGEAFYEEDEG